MSCMVITKRDGSVVPYNLTKINLAVTNASIRVGKLVPTEILSGIEDIILSRYEENKGSISVEEIQSIVLSA